MAIFVKIVKARRTEDGIIIHELDNGESRKYVAIRGGLSWPLMSEELPGYYCTIGEELIPAALRKQNQRGKLILLSEYEASDILSLSDFLIKLTDDVKLLECDVFYTVTKELRREDQNGYTEAFRHFVYEKEISVHLEEAPWADKPELGIHYINEWITNCLLDLPEESFVRSQLRMVEAEKVNQLPQTLNAVNALRFVVCGFEKYRPSPIPKNWRERAPRTTWKTV